MSLLLWLDSISLKPCTDFNVLSWSLEIKEVLILHYYLAPPFSTVRRRLCCLLSVVFETSAVLHFELCAHVKYSSV